MKSLFYLVKKAFAFVIETDLKEGKFIKEPSNENEKVRVNVVLPRFVLDEIKKGDFDEK